MPFSFFKRKKRTPTPDKLNLGRRRFLQRIALFGGAAALGVVGGKKISPHLIERERRRIARVQEHAKGGRWKQLMEQPSHIRASMLGRQELEALVDAHQLDVPRQYTVSRFVSEWMDHLHQFTPSFDASLGRLLGYSPSPSHNPFQKISANTLIAFMRLHGAVPHYTPYQLLEELSLTMPTHNDSNNFFEKRDWPGEEPMSRREKHSLSLWRRLSEQEGGLEVIREIRLLVNKRD